jgi:hypothetical protein
LVHLPVARLDPEPQPVRLPDPIERVDSRKVAMVRGSR